MRTLTEDEIVDLFIGYLGNLYDPGEGLSVKDDAGRAAEGYLLNVDGYGSFNSRYPWESWADWAWKAVVGSIADLIAKGAQPVALGLSLGLPRGEHLEAMVSELAAGLREVCREYNLRIVKADTNRSQGDAWISVASIGRLVLGRPISRRGIRGGEYVYTTLGNGYGRLVAIFNRYLAGKLGFDEARRLYRRPRAPIRYLHLLRRVGVHSAIDSSDGLARSLGIIAEENGLSIYLESLPRPEADVSPLFESEEEVEREVLYGGEEYEVIFTSPSPPEEVLRQCGEADLRCEYLGVAVAGERGKVYLGGREIDTVGWRHF